MGIPLTNDILVNVVVREGVVKARVSILAFKSSFLHRQTCRILVLKGLPVAGREGKAVKKCGLAAVLKIATVILFTLLSGV